MGFLDAPLPPQQGAAPPRFAFFVGGCLHAATQLLHFVDIPQQRSRDISGRGCLGTFRVGFCGTRPRRGFLDAVEQVLLEVAALGLLATPQNLRRAFWIPFEQGLLDTPRAAAGLFGYRSHVLLLHPAHVLFSIFQ